MTTDRQAQARTAVAVTDEEQAAQLARLQAELMQLRRDARGAAAAIARIVAQVEALLGMDDRDGRPPTPRDASQ